MEQAEKWETTKLQKEQTRTKSKQKPKKTEATPAMQQVHLKDAQNAPTPDNPTVTENPTINTVKKVLKSHRPS